MAKADPSKSKEERDALSHSLKITANAGSYGLFVQLDPERVGKDSKSGRDKVRVFSGESKFETTSEIFEKPGPWYFPIFGALITAAGRLLLAMLERCGSRSPHLKCLKLYKRATKIAGTRTKLSHSTLFSVR
jgi:hypothetical protein